MKKHSGSMLAYLNTTTQEAIQKPSVYAVENIDAEKIIPNERNFYSVEGIEEMANSLAVSDHMPPLEVVSNGDGTYRLISGERRLSATLCRIRRGEIKKAELPCHILPAFTARGALSAEQVEMLHIILANNYRQKTPLDQLNEVKELEPIARALYNEAKESGELSGGDGSNMRFRTFFAKEILEMSEASLQRLQLLTELSEDAKKAFDAGCIGKSVAIQLASLPASVQDDFVRATRDGDIVGTVADVERWKEAWKNGETDLTKAFETVEENLAESQGDIEHQDNIEESSSCISEENRESISQSEASSEVTTDAERNQEHEEEEEVSYEEKWEKKGQTRLFDSVPENLTPAEAEEDAKKWIIENLKRLASDVQEKIDALTMVNRSIEAARWNVRLSSIQLVIETIR